MSWTRRFANLFHTKRVEKEIAEELASHIEEAIEQGRPVEEVRQAFGNQLLQRERSRDIKLVPWIDSLISDVVFGFRQLCKRPVVTAAAVLSLALAIGASTAAFRLVNATLLRTLPVAEPERLFYLAASYIDRDGHPDYRDDFDYPTFRRYREAVADRADLMVVGFTAREDAAFGSGAETEKIYRQYLSGNVFSVFGLHPALGRLLAPYDDSTPGAAPVAVLSYEYWTHRFARDPKVIGETFRMGNDRFQIVGVAPQGFIGTEPGEITDVFIPAMMNTEAINSPGWSWFRIWAYPRTGFTAEQVRQPLQALFTREHHEQLKHFSSDTTKAETEAYLRERLFLFAAAAGASDVQRQYRRPLLILTVLVALVLLIACTNVGNLLTAQAAARGHEMALRISIGAGRWRLIQLLLVESALLATSASVLGTFFASWSTPLVVSMLHVPEDPVRFVLDSGWRDLLFTMALASFVALLFGLGPALRASAVRPVAALKGSEDGRPSYRRWLNGVMAAQMAFCVLVLFLAGLFVSTFQHLTQRRLGFTADHVLVMDSAAPKKEPMQVWMQVADRLRSTPGVQSVALAGWPLLSRNRWTTDLRIPGHHTEAHSAYVLDVSPGFFATMHIAMIGGRDFRLGDHYSDTARPLLRVGIVNEAFARAYLNGRNPVGRSVDIPNKDLSSPVEIIGYVRNAVYYDVRETIQPTIYIPMEERDFNTFLIRSVGDPLALAPTLRRIVPKVRSDFKVHTIQSQSAFLRWQMLRERLLAALSFFFAVIALALSAIGLFGLLNYSVTRQRREIGICVALGARPSHVVHRITGGLLSMVSLGLFVGLVIGVVCGRVVQSLLFEVKIADPVTMVGPLTILLCVAALASLPPAIRAVRVDPAQTLRNE